MPGECSPGPGCVRPTSRRADPTLGFMTAVEDDALALMLAVQDERRRPFRERSSEAADEDLDVVAAVLHALTRPDRVDGGAMLAGVIGRTFTDRWSLTCDLCEGAARCRGVVYRRSGRA